VWCVFFLQGEGGIRGWAVTGVQTCALPIWCNAVQPCADALGSIPASSSAAAASKFKPCTAVTRALVPSGSASSIRAPAAASASKIGRASCRERGWDWGGGGRLEREEVVKRG